MDCLLLNVFLFEEDQTKYFFIRALTRAQEIFLVN